MIDRMQIFGFVLAMAVLHRGVCGQAFNIDCAGHLGTPPNSTYGAGSGQRGYWNPSGIDPVLRDLNGNVTGATIGAGGSSNVHNIPGATGNDALFMETTFDASATAPVVVITNLAAGPYDLYAYSWGGQIFGPREVGFIVATGSGTTYIGSLTFGTQWPGGQVEGETFARIPIKVVEGLNLLTLRIGGGGPETFNVLAGIQLVPVPAPGSVAAFMSAALFALRPRRRPSTN